MNIFTEKEIQKISTDITEKKLSRKTAIWLGKIVERQFLARLGKISQKTKLKCNIELEVSHYRGKSRRKLYRGVFGKKIGDLIFRLVRHAFDKRGELRMTRNLGKPHGDRLRGLRPLEISESRRGQFSDENKNLFYDSLDLFIQEVIQETFSVFDKVSKRCIEEVAFGGRFRYFFDDEISAPKRVILRWIK